MAKLAGWRMSAEIGDKKVNVSRTWYRGEDCNFGPEFSNLNEEGAIEKYILHGWVPDAPVIGSRAKVLAVGSCFASHIASYLRKLRGGALKVNDDEGVNLFRWGAGFVNTYTLRQQFEWGLGKRDIESGTLFVENLGNMHGRVHATMVMPTDEDTRAATRKSITESEAFIITLGLSEIWYEKSTGDAFFGAIPSKEFDSDRHGFRVSTVEENRENILAIVDMIREHQPDAPIIFTLSPVPLTATFRPVSCITANTVSKSILRVAVDEALREREGDGMIFYWPSYEIVQELYGLKAYERDRKHIRRPVVGKIMTLFSEHFVEPIVDQPSSEESESSSDSLGSAGSGSVSLSDESSSPSPTRASIAST